MYGGDFLPGDYRQSWTISMRERLKSRFIRLVGRLGNYYEEARQWEDVTECYQKALEVDDLQEEFFAEDSCRLAKKWGTTESQRVLMEVARFE